MKLGWLLIVCLLLFSSLALAQSTQSLTLLTVHELENGSLYGGTASMVLTIKEGTGSIFIESFPLSKIDTQAATRIATEIACEFSTQNCDHYDFFYTIRADSPLIGGPSAGGATALLALATLEEKELRPLAMTGGISSGGLISSVGGISEKVVAAQEQDTSLILIPRIALNNSNNATNETPLFLSDLQTNPASVYPVSSLSEAFYLGTGHALDSYTLEEPPTYYYDTMKKTAGLLCQRTASLFEQVKETNNTLYTDAQDFYNKSLFSVNDNDYYSAASYCYTANLRLRELIVDELSQEVREENFYRLIQSHATLEEQIETYPLTTLSDLETYIVVKERLLESQNYIEDLNVTNISSQTLSYAIERYFSAVAWSNFFGLPGKELIIDQASMRLACMNEVKTVENRLNYLRTLLPEIFLREIQEQLQGSYDQLEVNNYALCFFKATKAKAHANVFLTQAVGETQITNAVLVKQQRAQELIAAQQERDLFPILGYSYYEYSTRLLEDQPITSLLFTEYSLGMSDLSNYFPDAKRNLWTPQRQVQLIMFLIGTLFGIALTKLFSKKPTKKRR